jgi:hypothetical protein
MLFKNCLVCKKKFRTFPSSVKRGDGKFCSQKCSQLYHTGKNHPFFGKHHSPEIIAKIKQAVKGKSARYWLGKHHSLETRKKISKNNYWRGRNGELSARWNGGRRISNDGYVFIYKPDHPRADQHKYIKEHWLIAEKCLGRYLTKDEQIHHINGIKTDNRPENLYLFPSNKEHVYFHKHTSRKELQSLMSNIIKS